MLRNLRIGIASLVMVSATSFVAHAQDSTTTVAPGVAPEVTSAEPQTPPPTETKVMKKIVVTGSYIRRNIDEGAPSPVTQIDAGAKAAEASSQTAGGILKDNAVIAGAGTNVSFHGQSSGNNLVLLNGLRIPKPGGNDSASIDFIPSSAIERVEVLKDGASALYGSEALAGVVNIITKKEYDGGNVGVRYQRADMVNAPESTLTATYGKNFGSGNILGAFQFRNVQPIDYKETIYGMTDVPTQGSDVSSPGNLKKNQGPYLHANDCPPGNLNGASCRYNYYQNGLQFTSEQEYYNGLLATGWDLGNKFRLEATTVYTHRKSEDLNTPIIARFENEVGGNNYSVTDAQAAQWAGNLSGPITPGTYNVLYSADEELGRRRDINTTDAGAFQMTVGRESELFDWDFAAGYSMADSETRTVNGNANKSIMYNKLIAGSWNPFALTGTKGGQLDDARIETWNTNFSDVTNGRFIASGRVIPWGDRSVYAAFGIEEQYQSYRFRADPFSLNNVALTGESSNQDGKRDVFSSFLELTQNPIHNLQVQLAGRFDKYSDFGSTVNPKLALAYKVTDEFMVRTSYGTGFKAPDLRSLFQGKLSRPQRFRDQVQCDIDPSGANPNCNNLYTVTTQGNPNLDAEKGSHYNLGIQIRPKKNWQISVDHWRAKGENALNSVSLQSLTEAEAQFGAGILDSIGVQIIRDPAQVIQKVIIPVRTNSGTYDVNGIDFEAKYKNQFNPWNTGSVNFNFKFDHSHLLHSGSQPFFFDDYSVNRDLNWKNITSFSLSKGTHLVSWRLRTYSGGDIDNSNSGVGVGSLPTYTENDIHYEYYGAWNGIITAGIRNLFNELPVNNYSRGRPGMVLPAGDTTLGRTVYVGYSQDF